MCLVFPCDSFVHLSLFIETFLYRYLKLTYRLYLKEHKQQLGHY